MSTYQTGPRRHSSPPNSSREWKEESPYGYFAPSPSSSVARKALATQVDPMGSHHSTERNEGVKPLGRESTKAAESGGRFSPIARGRSIPDPHPRWSPGKAPLSRSATFNELMLGDDVQNYNIDLGVESQGSEPPQIGPLQYELPAVQLTAIESNSRREVPEDKVSRSIGIEEIEYLPDFSQYSHTQLLQELRRVYVENAALRNISSEAAMEINSLKSEKNYNRDDKFFEERIHQLRYKIRNWAAMHFSGEVPQKSMLATSQKGSKEFIFHLTFDQEYARGLFASNEYRQFLVQAYIWSVLQSRILSNKGNVWAGGLKSHLTELQEKLDPTAYRNVTEADLRYYHTWRAATTGLLQERIHNSADEEQQHVTKIASDLKWLLRYSSSSKNQIEPELLDIFGLAVKLDGEIKKQRAFYYFEWVDINRQRGRVYFDEESMEPAERPLEPQDRIAFILSPALMKRGTSSGVGYSNHPIVITRASVLGYHSAQRLPPRGSEQRDQKQLTATPLRRERSRSRSRVRGSMDQSHPETIGSAVTKPKPLGKKGSWLGF